MTSTKFSCEFCKTECSNKYILKNHIETSKKCLNIRSTISSIIYTCNGCDTICTTKGNLLYHQKICQLFLLKEENKQIKTKIAELSKMNGSEQEIEKLKIKYENDIESINKIHEMEIKVITLSHESQRQLLQKQIDDMNTIIRSTLSESVNKPSVTNQSHINNTQHISFRDCLSKDHTVDQLNENHLVERLRISMTEKMFFGGLRDIARLCYDCIVKLKDGKMILCCTDISRGKFKMYDLYGNIKEDIEARYFTEKVGKSLKVAGTEIYNCIMQSIEDEKSMLTETDYKRKEELLDKFKRTCDAYIEIINVDDPGRNNEFINELAALTSVHAITTPLEPNTNPKRIIHNGLLRECS